MDRHVEEFLHEANTRIEDALTDKLRLLGYPKHTVKAAIASGELKLVQALLYNQPDYVKEEYSANGILLFWVEWTTDKVNLIDPIIDEKDLPYDR